MNPELYYIQNFHASAIQSEAIQVSGYHLQFMGSKRQIKNKQTDLSEISEEEFRPSFKFNKLSCDTDSNESDFESENLKSKNLEISEKEPIVKYDTEVQMPKKPAKNSSNNLDDLDDILAEFGFEGAATKIEEPSKSKSKKKGKNKANEAKSITEAEPKTEVKESGKLEPKSEVPEEIEAAEKKKHVDNKIEENVEIVDPEDDEKKDGDAKSKNKKKKPKKKGGNSEVKPKAMSAAARLAQQRLQLIEEERKREQEEARIQEELERKQEQEEEERKLKEAEEKARLKRIKMERKERLRKEGKLLSAAAKERQKKNALLREQLLKTMELPQDVEAGTSLKSKRSKIVKSFKSKNKKLAETSAPVEEIVTQKSSEEIVESQSAAYAEEEVEDKCDESAASSWDKSSSEDEEVAQKKTMCAKIAEAAKQADKIPKVANVRSKYAQTKRKAAAAAEKLIEEFENDKLRSPICCVLGHVDTGKTKLLDCIRSTNVQNEEAGGITQQIGATYIPYANLKKSCEICDPSFIMKVPGLLIIDTPGHESFNNLRARGTAVCDIAILVVDIMHGLEPQTRESIDILRARKCPFIIALNKIDRLYQWKVSSKTNVTSEATKETYQFSCSVEKIIYSQESFVIEEFENRLSNIIVQLAEVGLNANLYWTVDKVRSTVSIVPTSAITGEGLADLLYLLLKLPQTLMYKSLILKPELQCTVLEVKNIEGLGVTVDVILVSGRLHENETIVLCGMHEPIVTTIRALLTPHPMRELRVKSEYQHHPYIDGAMGIKIYAPGLDEVVAGTSLLSARNKTATEIEAMKEEVMADMTSIFKSVDRSGIGVYVMASTLGSLEALLIFLKASKIPVAAVNLGCINKIDVKRASIMQEKQRPEYACILAFDVKADAEALKEAAALDVTVFQSDIIYHLFDKFNKHIFDYQENVKKEKRGIVQFPCVLSILPSYIFNKRDPIILGVRVERGFLCVGTQLCIPEKDTLILGKVQSIEHNNKPVSEARKDSEVAIKIIGDPSISYGRHFDNTHKVYSRLTRESIDALKQFFKDEMTQDDWKTVIDIKKVLSIS